MNKAQLLSSSKQVTTFIEKGGIPYLAAYLRAQNPYVKGGFQPTELALQTNGAAIGFERAVADLENLLTSEQQKSTTHIQLYSDPAK